MSPCFQPVRSIKKGLSLFLALCCLLTGHRIQAGSYGVNPVKLTLSSGNSTQVMTLRNNGAQAAVMQVELVKWTQAQGQDSYTPTRDLLATPPIFNVPAGGVQIIRIGLRHAPDPQREQAYRMFLQEVPPPPKLDAVGLQVALRISIPVFIAPSQPVKPVLRWKAVRIDEHTLKIEVFNSGNVHDHLSAFKIYRKGSNAPFQSQQLFVYLLPGEKRDWTLSTDVMPPPGESLRVSANTDTGIVETDLTMDKP
jgi:fimbrial chaperone protein